MQEWVQPIWLHVASLLKGRVAKHGLIMRLTLITLLKPTEEYILSQLPLQLIVQNATLHNAHKRGTKSKHSLL